MAITCGTIQTFPVPNYIGETALYSNIFNYTSVLSKISFCKSDSHPLQVTVPSAALEQFIMGAVNTSGDAEIAHLEVLHRERQRNLSDLKPLLGSHAEFSFELVVGHVLRPVVGLCALAPAA
jgi:hypothetical protein